jgi:hypothetical protein
MPYANNQGIRIHYEVEGVGPLLYCTTARLVVGNIGRILVTWMP